ncbi:hypothetical protein CHS0354_023799 [Potamilus streckersoni]|uniref:Glucokinase n=1 Tax=Potamilus streckersoni TaxID=2493646 RepID=A0AAE0RZ96_9BIVA|nr:hypothetical protein CHS0354_023799 [Potamilus streckersoni]
MPEPQPRERDYAFVGSFYVFGLWIGLGMSGIYDYIRKWLLRDEKKSLMAVSLASILGLVFINGRMVQVNYFENSRAGNYAPYDYAFNILQSCDKDGIIFTNGDNDTFPLWYIQEAMGIRQDVRVVNLSLANTDWYIKQLINEEPRGANKIRMNLNQTDLEKFSYQPWSARDISLQIDKLQMMQEMKDKYLRRERQLLNVPKEMLPSLLPDVMTWRFEPTVNYQGQGYIRLQDRVVYEIIMNNLNDRPVYFSATVSDDNRIGIDDFLQLEGYAFRVVPIKAKGDVEPNINYQKIMRVFQYRNFTNKNVYYDEVARRMIGQYKSIFLQAASSFSKSPKDTTLIQDETVKFVPRTNKEIAEEITDFTLKTISTEIWETPFYNTVNAIEIYAEIGSRAKAKSLLPEAESLVLNYVEENPNDLMSKYYLAKAYKSLDDTDKAVELLEEVQKGMGEHVVARGVDIGGTSIKFGLVEIGRGLVKESFVATEVERGASAIIGKIAQEAKKYSKEYSKNKLFLIGIGVPGAVTLDGGTVSYPPNFPGWQVVRLGDEVRRQYERISGMKCNVVVENDANVAALGECYFGAGTSFQDFVMLTLGTGVGGGIIINNKIYRGSTGSAAELGHFTIDWKSDTIHAGIRGTMEGLIGWKKIVSGFEKLQAEALNSDYQFTDQKNLTTESLYQAAKNGDKTALAVWHYVGEVLGVGIGTLVSILDIRKFIIGGGVAGAFEFFKPVAEETLKHYCMKSMHADIEILKAKLGNKAGIVGAGSLCFH